MGYSGKVRDKFADVVPLLYLPCGVTQEFTYRVPIVLVSKIVVGQIVVVDFRQRKTFGVVRNLSYATSTSLGKILEIKSVLPYSALTPGQMVIIDALENYYGASRTLAYKTVVPRLISQPIEEGHALTPIIESPSLAGFNRQTLRLLLGTKSKLTITGALYDPRHPLFLKYMCERIKKGGQILCLFPDKESLRLAFASYEKYFGQSLTAMWHSELPPRILSRIWSRIHKGQIQVIAATRSGMMLPFSRLRAIILFDESDDNYKSWDQQPYYDARMLAEKSASYQRLPYLVTRLLPPLQHHFHIFGKVQAARSNLTIIDRRALRLEPRETFIPPAIIDVVKESSAHNQCLIFINHLGYASLLCADCHHLFKCNKCGFHLTLIREKRKDQGLRCFKCGKFEAGANTCPQCQGINFRYLGIGINRIQEELTKKFPDKLIQCLDRREIKTDGQLQKSLDNIREHRVEVTLSSAIILSRLWSLPLFKTVVILRAESLFLAPDWRANENAFNTLKKLWASSAGNFYLETNLSDHTVIKALKASTDKEFYKNELAERARFNYPPFSRLIKLIARNKHANLKIQEIHKIGNIESIDIPGVRRIILLKTPLNMPPQRIWPHLNKEWKIDVDPITIT